MARRPAPPRPTGSRRSLQQSGRVPPQSGRAPQRPLEAQQGHAPREAAPSDPPGRSYGRSSVTAVDAPRNPRPEPRGTRPELREPRPDASDSPDGPDNVVPAAYRFRALVAGRPWRRRRRAIIAGAVVVTLLLIGVLSAAIWLPALRLQQISVTGLGYVEEQAVRSHLDPRLGDSVLMLPTDAIGEDLATVPGIESAQVERRWPDGMHVTVVESEPVGHLTRADGTVAVLDAAGEELPAAAAEGATLIPLRVGTTSQDPDGAAEAMTEVLAELPDPIRPAVQDMTATSPSDVTFTLALEDGSTKSVVWGDARDAELKGDVVQALIPQPGSVIDVSSPVAPVTR